MISFFFHIIRQILVQFLIKNLTLPGAYAYDYFPLFFAINRTGEAD